MAASTVIEQERLWLERQLARRFGTMQSKPQQPPTKHHFVPEFLLKEWKNSEGKIWRYFRNDRGEIDCKALAPAGMGYQPGLYATEGLPPEHKQQVETKFMEPLDTAAARVHQHLLDGQFHELTDEERSRWASLVMSLWFRTPGEVNGIREAVEAAYEGHVAKTALDMASSVELPSAARNQLAMEVMMRAIDDGDRGGELINMDWDVIEIDRSREFFISDSPLSRPDGFARLGASASCVGLPIAPTKLFVAADSRSVIAAIKKLPPRELVLGQNRATVGQAEHFVGTTARSADKFIRETFGTGERTSLVRNIAENFAVGRERRR